MGGGILVTHARAMGAPSLITNSSVYRSPCRMALRQWSLSRCRRKCCCRSPQVAGHGPCAFAQAVTSPHYKKNALEPWDSKYRSCEINITHRYNAHHTDSNRSYNLTNSGGLLCGPCYNLGAICSGSPCYQKPHLQISPIFLFSAHYDA